MKLLMTTLTGLTTATLFAVTAQAAEMSDKTSKTIKSVETIDADGEVSVKTVEVAPTDMHRTAVMSAYAEQNTDAYIVEGENGQLYINHLIPVSELPDPTLAVRTEDTYSVEYQGMTFTNRVVSE